MDKQKWAQEPWDVGYGNEGASSIYSDKTGLVFYARDVTGDHPPIGLGDSLERAASCVNACAGLNPEAIPGLVEAAKDLTLAWKGRAPHMIKHRLSLDLHVALMAVTGLKESETSNG